MPHSSGGGSHSGGSYSGGSSYSSSGGGSGSSRRKSDEPFNGSKMYLYYEDRKPHFVYSNYDISKYDVRSIVFSIILLAIVFIPLIVLSIVGMVYSFKKPCKIEYFKGQHPEIIIEDTLGIFEDEESLKSSLEEFYDVTGIVPAVITVNNSEWKQDYDSIGKYAYDVYVDRFPDEAHWLIVYSEEIKADGFNDWYWEGMQGDRTDPALTSVRAGAFTKSLHKRLLQREKYSVDEAIRLTFDEFTPEMMKTDVNKLMLGGCLIMLPLFLVALFFSGRFLLKGLLVPEKYKDAKLVELNAVYQESCSFCGGVYIIGMHGECPHCGAAIPDHHYVKDAKGNLVQVL